MKRKCFKVIFFCFFTFLATANAGVCLVESESSRNTAIKGGPNKNGSYDYGLFQINSRYWCKVGQPGGDCKVDCNIPVSVVTANGEPPESLEIPEELIIDDDDLTTRNLERLVSAATCLVAGVEYTHGQQIYRADQCEFCLCLDGEMFCWWQDCPPTAEGPCRDRRPFSPCANAIEAGQQSVKPTTSRSTSSTQTHKSSSTSTTSTMTSADLEDSWSTSENQTVSEESSTESTIEEENSGGTERSTTSASSCIVMGTEYKIGEMLPHATGNCLECVCSAGARVTCSPHLCAPPGDDAVDYRPPGPF